jgi:ferritin-like protein
MGQVANQVLSGGIDTAELGDSLDSLYCYHMVGFCWALSMGTRLEGRALFLLGDELEEVAEEHLASAKSLAQRISEIGAVTTADPSEFLKRSPFEDLTTPEPGSVEGILRYALAAIRAGLASYGAIINRTRGTDDASHLLLVKLARKQASRETDIEGVLTAP